MKNLSYSPTKQIEKKVVEIINDDRVFITYEEDEIGFFLSSNGKALMFSNENFAKSYLKKIKHEEYEIWLITELPLNLYDTILIK